MPVPDFQSLMLPALQAFADGVVAAALRRRALRADVRAVQHGMPQPGEPCEGIVFHLAFSESGHQAVALPVPKTKFARSRRSIP